MSSAYFGKQMGLARRMVNRPAVPLSPCATDSDKLNDEEEVANVTAKSYPLWVVLGRGRRLFFAVWMFLVSACLIIEHLPIPLQFPPLEQPQRAAVEPIVVYSYSKQQKDVDDPLVKPHLLHFVQDFQEVAASRLEIQIGSWYRHLGYDRFSASEAQKVIGKEEHDGEKNKHQRSITNKTSSKTDNMIIWDDEKDDIPNYFATLERECSKNSTIDDKVADACFGYVQRLVREPRCTVRLDSRVQCSSSKKEASETIPIESILGPNHFASNTLNIAIVGAGPVGLYLANALMVMQGLNSTSSPLHSGNGTGRPDMRIVVFENRVMSEGHKKPYQRDWITGLGGYFLTSAVDPRILDLLGIMCKKVKNEIPNTVWPLNWWETLLLLSNRERGVKFIYGNMKDYEALLYRVPNLVVFDATGHRLDQLDRGEQDPEEPSEPVQGVQYSTVPNWMASSRVMHRQVKRSWDADWDIIEKEKIPLPVAYRKSKAGSIIYPVLPGVSNRKTAYDVNMLKVLDLPNHRGLYMALRTIRYSTNALNRFRWGGPHFSYSTYDSFREDLMQRINEHYQGFPTRTLFIILTPEQENAMQKLIMRYSEDGRTEIPLSKIPLNAISEDPLWKTNNVGDALLVAMRYHFTTLGKNGPGPIISAFKYRPYIYDDPVVPNGYNLVGDDGRSRRVPLLRVGDSLFTGDPNASSGLARHMQLIRFFQCRLWNITGENCSLDGALQRRQKEIDAQNRRARSNSL